MTPLARLLPWFFLSGAVALGCEAAWFRALTVLLGASLPATGLLLGVFLGGLGLGAVLGGRLSEVLARPARGYALAEALVALSAGTSPWLLGRLEPLGALDSVPARVALCALVLAPPTVCMGASLPLLVRAAGGGLQRAVGALQAANLAGAMTGALFTGLVLLPAWGVRRALGGWSLVALGTALGVWATAPTQGHALKEEAPDPQDDPVALGVLCALGMVSFALQVCHTRALAVLLGSSAYTFALVSAAVLAGNSLGGLWGAGSAAEGRWGEGASRGFFALAVLVWLGTLWVHAAPGFLAWAAVRGRGLGPSAGVLLGVVLPPAVLVGRLYPSLVAQGGGRGGRSVGRAVAVGTAGNVLGALGAAFGAIPRWGLQGTLQAVALGCLGVACVCAAQGGLGGCSVGYSGRLASASRRQSSSGLFARPPALLRSPSLPGSRRLENASRKPTGQPLTRLRATLVASALAVLVAQGTGPAWDLASLSAGSFRARLYRERFRARGEDCGPSRRFTDRRVLYARDGALGTVVVLGLPGGPRCSLYSLRINGKAEGSVFVGGPLGSRVEPTSVLLPVGDLPTEVLAGWLPGAAGPPAQRAFLVGWGTGLSTRALLATGPWRVRAVELEPSVYEAARLFDAGALDDPRVERRVDDARTALRREPAGSLDVVASHPSNPWVSGAGALFSREYFQLARSRLRAGGRMLAWVQLYETDREAVRTLVATFLESFPESHAFRPSASSRDLLLLGFRDAGALRERFPTALSAEALGALRRAGVTNLDGVLALRVAGPAALARWSRGAWVSTDDNGALEYRVAAGLRRGAEATPEAVLGGLSALEVAAPPPPPPPPPLERRNLQ